VPDPDPLVALAQNVEDFDFVHEQVSTSGRLLIVSPKRDGTPNAGDDTLGANATRCTCTKPTVDEALDYTGTSASDLMFVAHHGCHIAGQLFQEHDSWCGVQLLHDPSGTFHAAWVGPFYTDGTEPSERTVRHLVRQRGLIQHVRMFDAPNFPEVSASSDSMDWDYIFEARNYDKEWVDSANDEEPHEGKEDEQPNDVEAGEKTADG
jgi:hypothetical protein